MKKTLALLLTLVMLGSLTVTLVSAEPYSVNWEAFANYRGMNVYIGDEADRSPVVDGFVEAGEYSYSQYTGPDQIYNYASGEIDSGVTEYFAHDANYVYYAVEFQQSAFNRAFQWQFKPFNSFDIYHDSTELTSYYYTRISWQARHTEDDYGEPYTNYFDKYAPSINGDCVPVPDVYGGEELICKSSWSYDNLKTYEVRLSKTYLSEVNGCGKEDIRVIPYFTYFHSRAAVGHIYTSDDLLELSNVAYDAFQPTLDDVGYRFIVLDTEDSAPEFVPPEAPEVDEIVAGETKLVRINTPADVRVFVFTPTTSGTYEFYSTGDCVPMGMIFDAEGEVLATGFDSKLQSNFSVTYDLEAGEPYILATSLIDQEATGSFAVGIQLIASESNEELWFDITKDMGLHIYIGDYIFRAPIQDGIVENGEYSYSRYVAPSEIYNYASGEIQSGVTEYFAHDDQYVYYAAVFKQSLNNRAFQWQFRPFNTFDIYGDTSDWAHYYYARVGWQARYKVNSYGYPYTEYDGSYAPSIHNNCVRVPEVYNELICHAEKTDSGYKTYEVKLSKSYLAEINNCTPNDLYVVPYMTYFHSTAAVGHTYTAEEIETLYANGATISFDTGVGELGYNFIVLGNDPDGGEPDQPDNPDDTDELYPINVGDAVVSPTMRAGESMVFVFEPSVSGKYDFYSIGSYDTSCNIVSSDFEILYTDDNGGENYNFYVCADLEAGKTYYLQGMMWDVGTTTFKLERHTHSWGNGVTTKAPTLDEEGIKIYTCNCGETLTDTIPKLDPPASTDDQGAESTGAASTEAEASSTKKPTTKKPSADEEADDTTEAISTTAEATTAEVGGCQSSLTACALALVPALAGGALLLKRRKED